MNILLLCNGFKGTLSSGEANAAVAEGVRALMPEADIHSYELADGGQGASSIVAHVAGAERIELEVVGPDCLPVNGFYYRTATQAFVEIAAASGLVDSDLSKPLSTKTSYGTGQLIRHAVENNCESISVFFGGSATNDAGIGMAKALGVKFYDDSGNDLPEPALGLRMYPGEQPGRVAKIDKTELVIKKSHTLLGVVDVSNPLCGEKGASAVFGPQKGGTPDELLRLDSDFRKLESLVLEPAEQEMVSGLGAAGGAAFGLYAFLGGKVVSGPSYFLDLMNINEQIEWADVIITGEGKFDRQSVEGKLTAELYRRCRLAQKELYVLAGVVDLRKEEELLDGLFACDTTVIKEPGTPFEKLSALAKYFTKQVLLNE